jgi:hypothetical protein
MKEGERERGIIKVNKYLLGALAALGGAADLQQLYNYVAEHSTEVDKKCNFYFYFFILYYFKSFLITLIFKIRCIKV